MEWQISQTANRPWPGFREPTFSHHRDGLMGVLRILRKGVHQMVSASKNKKLARFVTEARTALRGESSNIDLLLQSYDPEPIGRDG
jgi:hypothetical protein